MPRAEPGALEGATLPRGAERETVAVSLTGVRLGLGATCPRLAPVAPPRFATFAAGFIPLGITSSPFCTERECSVSGSTSVSGQLQDSTFSSGPSRSRGSPRSPCSPRSSKPLGPRTSRVGAEGALYIRTRHQKIYHPQYRRPSTTSAEGSEEERGRRGENQKGKASLDCSGHSRRMASID